MSLVMRRGRALESFQVGEALGDSHDLVFTRIRRICDHRQIVAHLFIKGALAQFSGGVPASGCRGFHSVDRATDETEARAAGSSRHCEGCGCHSRSRGNVIMMPVSVTTTAGGP